jgi:hypothetical protein
MGDIRFKDKKGNVKYIADKEGKIWKTDKQGVKDKVVSAPGKEDKNEK